MASERLDELDPFGARENLATFVALGEIETRRELIFAVTLEFSILSLNFERFTLNWGRGEISSCNWNN